MNTDYWRHLKNFFNGFSAYFYWCVFFLSLPEVNDELFGFVYGQFLFVTPVLKGGNFSSVVGMLKIQQFSSGGTFILCSLLYRMAGLIVLKAELWSTNRILK